jgi:CHAT domain-containing protein
MREMASRSSSTLAPGIGTVSGEELRLVLTGVALLLAVAGLGGCRSRSSSPVDSLRAAASAQPHRIIDARMTLLDEYRPLSSPRRGPGPGAQAPLPVRAAAAGVLNAVVSRTTEQRRARAAAHLLMGDGEAAIEELREGPGADPDIQSDLAAALLFEAKRSGRVDLSIDAVTAADEALVANPQLAEASFNRALALEHLGLLTESADEWRRYLQLDSWSPWRAEGTAALQRLDIRGDPELWKGELDRLERAARTGDTITVAAVTSRFPQLARRHGETIHLASWADGDEGALTIARAVGAELHRLNGEALLRDAVAAIDSAAPSRRIILATAHRLYRDGRIAFRNHHLDEAASKLLAAEKAFAAAGSPMLLLATYYRGSIAHQALRIEEAERLLDSVAASGPEQLGYRALAAQIGWERGMSKLAGGDVSEAQEIFGVSKRIFASLGERDLEASLDLLIAVVEDFVGNKSEAWQHRAAAFATKSATDDYRIAVTLAGAASSSLRVEEWNRAATLALLADSMAKRLGEPIVASQALLLASRAEMGLGRVNRALAHLHSADDVISRMAGGPMKARLEVERGLSSAIILKTSDPRAAIAELDRAIAYYVQTGYEMMLPRALLERTRANRATGDLPAAIRDVESGLAIVERHRERIEDLEQRATFLSVAHSLFIERIGLALSEGDQAAAVYAVERGRARAILDGYRGRQLRSPLTLSEIQSALAPAAAIVLFARLEDRLAIFVIRDREVRIVETPRNDRRWIGALEVLRKSADDTDMRERSNAERELHAGLIQPVKYFLAGTETIAVVADPVLGRIPVKLLIASSIASTAMTGQTFIEAPSATLAIESSRRLRRLGEGSTLIVAANVFDPRLLGDSRPLPNVGAEARLIESIWPAARVLASEHATRAAFVQHAPRAGLIHFAGHGLHRPGHPSQAALLLAPSQDDRGEITAGEIARLDLSSTRLVILNACRTAAASDRADGVSNLSTAFIVAGVPTVIAAVDDVPDATAAAFSEKLHRHLRASIPPQIALRNVLHEEAARIGNAEAMAAYGGFTVFGGAKALVRETD